MFARYRFAVRFRLVPTVEGVSVDPTEFEATLYYRAPEPGTEGWRFFRDNLWRGNVADVPDFRRYAADALDVPITWVEFRALETDDEYLDALRAAVGEHLDDFRARTIDEALTKYLGGAIEVRDGE